MLQIGVWHIKCKRGPPEAFNYTDKSLAQLPVCHLSLTACKLHLSGISTSSFRFSVPLNVTLQHSNAISYYSFVNFARKISVHTNR